jgi:hypothetical protein
MFNTIFFICLVVGFLLRLYDGRVISVSTGLCAGVLLSELWRLMVWLVR